MTCGFVNRLCSGSNLLSYMAHRDYGQISIHLNAPGSLGPGPRAPGHMSKQHQSQSV